MSATPSTPKVTVQRPERVILGVALADIAAIAALAAAHVGVPTELAQALPILIGAGAGVSVPRRSSP